MVIMSITIFSTGAVAVASSAAAAVFGSGVVVIVVTVGLVGGRVEGK